MTTYFEKSFSTDLEYGDEKDVTFQEKYLIPIIVSKNIKRKFVVILTMHAIYICLTMGMA